MSLELEVGNKKATVFLNKDEIDNETLKQIKAMVKEEAIENAKIMPDCHKSKNCCVGFTSKLVNKIVPNYVGNDIGCGIVSYPIELEKSLNSFREKQLQKIIKDIDIYLTASDNWRSVINKPNNEYSFDTFSESVNRIFELSNIDIVKFQCYYKEKFGRDISNKIPIYNREWLEEFLKRNKISNKEFYGSLMTLGNGNHFIEFNRSQNDNEIF